MVTCLLYQLLEKLCDYCGIDYFVEHMEHYQTEKYVHLMKNVSSYNISVTLVVGYYA